MLDPVKKYAGSFLLRAIRWRGPAPYSCAWLSQHLLFTASPKIPREPHRKPPAFTVERPWLGWRDPSSAGSCKQMAGKSPSSTVINLRSFAELLARKHRHAPGSAASQDKPQVCESRDSPCLQPHPSSPTSCQHRGLSSATVQSEITARGPAASRAPL